MFRTDKQNCFNCGESYTVAYSGQLFCKAECEKEFYKRHPRLEPEEHRD